MALTDVLKTALASLRRLAMGSQKKSPFIRDPWPPIAEVKKNRFYYIIMSF